MKSSVMIVLTMLAASALSQEVDPLMLQPFVNLGPSSCPEVSVGPWFLVPWFPWPQSCNLIFAWIAWYPFPPRICYIYVCRYYFFGQYFTVYYKICRRLIFRNTWALDTTSVDANNYRNYVGATTLASSTNLNDITEGQKVFSERAVGCSFISELGRQAQRSTLSARY